MNPNEKRITGGRDISASLYQARQKSGKRPFLPTAEGCPDHRTGARIQLCMGIKL
jgi:hypothetical protein